MSFLNPLFLWLLPLVGIPLVIHLLNRRRTNVIRWGAMRFLAAAASRRRRIWNLKDWLLLCLRMAAVAMLVIAFARPLVRGGLAGGPWGPRDVILVLDTSMSTSRADARSGAGAGQLDELKRRAVTAINQLDSDDHVRILLACTVPRWLQQEPVPADPSVKADLLGRLAAVQAELSHADLPRCVQEALESPPAQSGLPRTVALLADSAAYGWNPPSAGWRRVRKALQSPAGDSTVNVVLLPTSERVPNVAVESVIAPRTVLAVGETMPLTATIRNTGSVPMQASQAVWTAGNTTIGTLPVPALNPGEATTLTVEFHAVDLGPLEVACRASAADDLAMDNQDAVVLEVAEAVPILVVDGTGRTDPARSDTAYLLAALGSGDGAPDQVWTSPFRVSVVQPPDLATQRLDDYRCIILANVSRLSQDVTTGVAEYARKGGGLWIVLGDQSSPAVLDPSFAGQPEVRPVSMASAATMPAGEPSFEIVRSAAVQHPAMRLLSDAPRSDLDRVQVYQRYRFGQPAAGKPVPVLLATGTGEPLAVEASSLGRGRVIIQGIPLTVGWSNLPASQAFVIMVHEWLWYLCEPAMTRRNLEVGETIHLPLGPAHAATKSRLLLPGGERVDVAAERRGERASVQYGPTVVPGTYELVLGSDGTSRQVFRVKRDPRESDLSPLALEQQRALADTAGLRFVSDPLSAPAGMADSAGLEPFWSALLTILLVALVLESAWAAAVSARRRPVRGDLSVGSV